MGTSRRSSEEVGVAVAMQTGERLSSGGYEDNNRVFVAQVPGFTAATAERDLTALMDTASNNPHLKANVDINDNDAPDVGATFCAAVVSGNQVHNASVGSTHCVLVTVNQEGDVALRLLNEPRHAEFVGLGTPQTSYHTATIEAKEGETNYVLLLSDGIIGPKTAPPKKDDYVSSVVDELQRKSNLPPKQYGLDRIQQLIQAKTKHQVASGEAVTEESIVAPFALVGVPYADRSSTALAVRVDPDQQAARMVVAADGVGGPEVAEALVAALPQQLNQVYSAEPASVVELMDAVPEEQVHGKEKDAAAPDTALDQEEEARTMRVLSAAFISSRSTLFKRPDHQVLQYPGYMPLQDPYSYDSSFSFSSNDLDRKQRYLDAVLMVLDEMVTDPNRESQENERLLILILHSMDSESRREFIDAARAEAEQLMRGRGEYCIEHLERFASRDALKQMAQEVNLEQEGTQDVVDVGVVDFDFFRDLPDKDEASVNRQALQAEVVELVKAIAWRLDDDGDLDDVLFDENILEAHMQLLEDALHIIPRKERAAFMDEVRNGFSDNPDVGRLQVAVLESAANRIKRGSLAVKMADVRKHADEAETAFYSREENKSTLSGLVKMQLELAQEEFGVEHGKSVSMKKTRGY